MPLTVAGATPILTANLVASGMLGTGVPKLSLGIATGLQLWTPTITVTTIDAGTLGVGVGTLPCIVAQPVLYGFLLESFASMGLMGPMCPLFCLGLSTGITLSYVQGIVTTTHPTVGVGTATAKFVPSPAPPMMIQGFAAVGSTGDGPTRTATAIGLALMKTFSSLVLPMPIVGSPSPSGSSGVGTGKIL